MATVSSAMAAGAVPVFSGMGAAHITLANGSTLGAAGPLLGAYGVFEITSALSTNDVIEYLNLPPSLVVWGFLQGDDIDTGTEVLEIDVGTSDDTNELLDSDVITGDAVLDVFPAHADGASFWRPFNGMKDGPVAYTAEQLIEALVVIQANAGGVGTTWLYCQYLARG